MLLAGAAVVAGCCVVVGGLGWVVLGGGTVVLWGGAVVLGAGVVVGADDVEDGGGRIAADGVAARMSVATRTANAVVRAITTRLRLASQPRATSTILGAESSLAPIDSAVSRITRSAARR